MSVRRFGSLALLFTFFFSAFALSCSDDKLIASTCREDDHCEQGFLCEDFRCVPAETKSCEVVIEGNPILQPTPYAVSFGELDTPEVSQLVQIHNIGNCTLTLFEAALKNGPESPFGCELCSARLPIEIFPGRSREFEISFQAKSIGVVSDELIILSDDREFPEMRVPLHANFLGVPDLRITPRPLDFGYVNKGLDAKKTVQITNQGTGTAAITVDSVTLQPDDSPDFTVVWQPVAGAGDEEQAFKPASLKPVATHRDDILRFVVQYHPRTSARHEAELVVNTNKGPVKVPLSGNAETPARITTSPDKIDLGDVRLGESNHERITLVNEGGAPLIVEYKWAGQRHNTDLFAVPGVLPPIAPGAHLELEVVFTATAVAKADGFLEFTTNDPSRPGFTVPVTARGIAGAGPQVVKIEMAYENGGDGAFNRDLRNVDLILEDPYGRLCSEQTPSPTDWGGFGNPSWTAFGPKKSPERIILVGANQDTDLNQPYRVRLNYIEDCASIPTELLAGILGISVDALLAYLTGGAIGAIGGVDIGKIIENICVSRKVANVTVTVTVNGTVVKEKTVALGRKGDLVEAVRLERKNGAFTAQ